MGVWGIDHAASKPKRRHTQQLRRLCSPAQGISPGSTDRVRPGGQRVPLVEAEGCEEAKTAVDDPYNMYFSPDGQSAIVVAEALKRLDLRDLPHDGITVVCCDPAGQGHQPADFSIDGRYVIFTCQFEGGLVKIDLVDRKVLLWPSG